MYLCTKGSDVDSDWLYADPDPQNLLSADPNPVQIQVNKIDKLIFNHLSKVKKKKNDVQICT